MPELLANGLAAAGSVDAAFDWHARRLGHDPVRLRGAAEVVTYPRLPSVAAVRELPAATPEQRRRRQEAWFGPSIAIRRSIGQGVHDRLEAAVFADGLVSPRDVARAGRHFPFPTRILSVRHRDVGPGEIWDLSVRGEHWGLDDRDDILNVVNVGSLRLGASSSVVVRGNLLILIVQRLTCDDADAGQLAVLPTPFPVDSGTGPLDGPGGIAGRDGTSGGDGSPVPTKATWLGVWLAGPVVPGARDGRAGGDATAGGDGTKARAGGASKTAEITIGELCGSLTIVATAGRGGDGGPGGDGGQGGPGGDGAPGQRTIEGFLLPGDGGAGGRGGDGGRGGHAGHGGIASNVFVSLPPHQARRLRVLSHPSPGGRGGAGGAGGEPGPGGAFGAGGTAGPGGADGTRGRDGRMRPAPPVFVNEVLADPMPAPAGVLSPDAESSRDTRRGVPPTTEAVPTTEGERQ